MTTEKCKKCDGAGVVGDHYGRFVHNVRSCHQCAGVGEMETVERTYKRAQRVVRGFFSWSPGKIYGTGMMAGMFQDRQARAEAGMSARARAQLAAYAVAARRLDTLGQHDATPEGRSVLAKEMRTAYRRALAS